MCNSDSPKKVLKDHNCLWFTTNDIFWRKMLPRFLIFNTIDINMVCKWKVCQCKLFCYFKLKWSLKNDKIRYQIFIKSKKTLHSNVKHLLIVILPSRLHHNKWTPLLTKCKLYELNIMNCRWHRLKIIHMKDLFNCATYNLFGVNS